MKNRGNHEESMQGLWRNHAGTMGENLKNIGGIQWKRHKSTMKEPRSRSILGEPWSNYRPNIDGPQMNHEWTMEEPWWRTAITKGRTWGITMENPLRLNDGEAFDVPWANSGEAMGEGWGNH